MADSAADGKKPQAAPAKNAGQAESVDDILAEIMNGDGTFNDAFNERFSQYIGESASQYTSVINTELSDRRGEARARQRIEYEDPTVRRKHFTDDNTRTDRRLEAKLPESVRQIYSEAQDEAQRPEFMPGGAVKYPSMGIGAAEERVVFDAEWEEKAKKEAARIKRVREDRMLRGDSTYVRSFVAGGRTLGGKTERVSANKSLIDPLSDSSEMSAPEYSRGGARNEENKSFFQAGPPARQRNNTASGRTQNGDSSVARTKRSEERILNDFASSHEKANAARLSWMQVDDPQTSKNRKKDKNKASARQPQKVSPVQHPALSSGLSAPVIEKKKRRSVPEADPGGLTQPKHRVKKAPKPEKPDPEEVRTTLEQTGELRSTVADIVNKYNKRAAEEEARRKKEEKERLLREEREKEERAKRRQGVSDDIIELLDKEESDEVFGGNYDDFTEKMKPEENAPEEETLSEEENALTEETAPEEESTAEAEKVPEEEEASEEDAAEKEEAPAKKKKKHEKKKKKAAGTEELHELLPEEEKPVVKEQPVISNAPVVSADPDAPVQTKFTFGLTQEEDVADEKKKKHRIGREKKKG